MIDAENKEVNKRDSDSGDTLQAHLEPKDMSRLEWAAFIPGLEGVPKAGEVYPGSAFILREYSFCYLVVVV